MAFPVTPTQGDQFTTPTGITYEFTALGTWRAIGAGAASATVLSWDTAGRPAAPDVGERGFNTDLSTMEVWDGAAWNAVGSGSGLPSNAFEFFNWGD